MNEMTPLVYKRVGITVKSDLDHRDDAVRTVIEILKNAGAEVLMEEKRKDRVPESVSVPCFSNVADLDLLLVIGGDGTILRTVRELACFSVPILSVNRGTVGFMAEMNISEAAELLPKFLRGEGHREERSVLRIEARRESRPLVEGFVLNEAVIAQGSIARLIDLKTTVNGDELTTFRADGLIIGTPTGSTAYTLAAGGPIVHPQIAATILTPINSHTFNQKPIVIPADHVVEVEVLGKSAKFGDLQVTLTLDGQTFTPLSRGDRIKASVHGERVTFLRRNSQTFYGTLRTKLKWGERPED